MLSFCGHPPSQVSDNLGINSFFVHNSVYLKSVLRKTEVFISNFSSAFSDTILVFFNLLSVSLCSVSTTLITKTIYLKERIVMNPVRVTNNQPKTKISKNHSRAEKTHETLRQKGF